MGDVYTGYLKGPRFDPWGNPVFSYNGSDETPSIVMDCVLPLKYDSSQLRDTPSIPNENLSLSIKIFWLIVSNAADWSNIIKSDILLLSMAHSKSSAIFISAVSVLWNFLYADWQGLYMLFSCRCLSSCLTTTFSINFYKNGRLLMGLYFFISSLSRFTFFKIGFTVAVLRHCGIRTGLKGHVDNFT